MRCNDIFGVGIDVFVCWCWQIEGDVEYVRAGEIINRVVFCWMGETIVLWFIIGGLKSADVWVVVLFVATEGNITVVVLSTELFWNWFDKSWSSIVVPLFYFFWKVWRW